MNSCTGGRSTRAGSVEAVTAALEPREATAARSDGDALIGIDETADEAEPAWTATGVILKLKRIAIVAAAQITTVREGLRSFISGVS